MRYITVPLLWFFVFFIIKFKAFPTIYVLVRACLELLRQPCMMIRSSTPTPLLLSLLRRKISAISSEMNDGKSSSNLTQINNLGWGNSARLIIEDAFNISVIAMERD